MIYKYNIDNKTKRKYFFNFIRSMLIIDFVIILTIFFIYKLSYENIMKIFLVLFFFTFIFYLLPLILLYLNYLKYNKKSELIINEDNSLNTFSFNDIKTTFLTSEIKEIRVHLSFPLFDKRMRWFYWDELFYYELILNNNTNIFISCLLCDDLSKHFPTAKILRKKRVIPIIRVPRSR